MTGMRYAAFMIAIAIGVALGLLYGWVVSPVELVDTAPSTLRIDFKADYVLMVAEAYNVNRDLDGAARKIGPLGGEPYETILTVQQFGASAGYDERDLLLLGSLGEALRDWVPGQELQATPTP
ncbi:MAG: hypothetical protein EPO32_00405 [Anaerolineae bacterium]|nr:MAG: hypothetical protein EPO32_00405 [Anaerolineae bacterium]